MLVKPDRVLLLESSTPVSGLIIVVLPKKFIELDGRSIWRAFDTSGQRLKNS